MSRRLDPTSPPAPTQSSGPEPGGPQSGGPDSLASDSAVAPSAVAPSAVAPSAVAPSAVAPSAVAPPAGGRWAVVRRAVDRVLRLAGGLIAVLAALLSALLEVFGASWRVGGVLTGGAALAAVAMNLAIAWFAVHTVGRRWALGLPWAAWTALMFFAVGFRTTEGDYLVAGDNWVGLVLMLVGSLAFALYAYRLILRGPPRR